MWMAASEEQRKHETRFRRAASMQLIRWKVTMWPASCDSTSYYLSSFHKAGLSQDQKNNSLYEATEDNTGRSLLETNKQTSAYFSHVSLSFFSWAAWHSWAVSFTFWNAWEQVNELVTERNNECVNIQPRRGQPVREETEQRHTGGPKPLLCDQ